jgi:T5SS/PEP-CTERM-associated repeat protein
MSRAVIAAVGAGASLLLYACGLVQGSGNVKTEGRSVHGFHKVQLNGTGTVIIDRGNRESLTIEAEDNILSVLESTVSGGVLNLGPKSGTAVSPTAPITYRLTAKDLDGLSIAGSGSINARKLDTATLTVDISGSGDVTTEGKAGDQRVSISGSGKFDGRALQGKTGSVSVTGSGSALTNVSNTLDVSVSGSGTVEYRGKPRLTEHITGSGTVTPAS